MMMLTPWVTRLLLANAAMYLVSLSLGGLPRILVLVPAVILTRPWTALTYMFLHAGFGHIGFNMLMLYFFGARLEERLGGTRFIRLYLISGLTGALFSVFTPYAPIVGASGAVFGVMYGFVRYWPRAQVLIWFVFPVEVRYLVGFLVVVAVLGGLGLGTPGVAHFAHLGGFVGSYLYLRLSQMHSGTSRFKAMVQGARKGRPLGKARDLDRWRKIKGQEMHPLNREELDRILDKISASGIASLSGGERAFLERFSAK